MKQIVLCISNPGLTVLSGAIASISKNVAIVNDPFGPPAIPYRSNGMITEIAMPFVEGQKADHPPFIRKSKKIGRNKPCPCGSGKKAKNCYHDKN